MKTIRTIALLSIAFLTLGGGAAAQCQLDGCTTNCGGGCGTSSFPIQHPTFGLGGNTAVFDLTATDFGPADGDTDCDSGAGQPCDNVGNIPPLRFWAYQDYVNANSGCALTTRVGQSWIINCDYDQPGCAGASVDGYWILSQSNWATPATPAMDTGDGCISASPLNRTVVEMSWGDTLSNEGTVAHDSWYAIASVDFTGTYDLDRITGGMSANGVGDGTIAAQSVPDVHFGDPSVCPDMVSPLCDANPNMFEPGFYDIEVVASDTSPPYLSEAGLNDPAAPLIVGLQVMYSASVTAPTTSDPAAWLPARDPASPSANVAGLIPFGGADTVTVSVPGNSASLWWLAVRVVYDDGTINGQTGPGPDAAAPRLASWVGGMCGPVNPVGIILAVTFDYVSAEHTPDGVLIRWATLEEDDVLGFILHHATDPDGADSAIVVDSFTESVGPAYAYAITDDEVSPSPDTTYYYQVQEITSSGPGMRSEWVEATVPGKAGAGRRGGGGRRRGLSRR